jgi:hypothetical protein
MFEDEAADDVVAWVRDKVSGNHLWGSQLVPTEFRPARSLTGALKSLTDLVSLLASEGRLSSAPGRFADPRLPQLIDIDDGTFLADGVLDQALGVGHARVSREVVKAALTSGGFLLGETTFRGRRGIVADARWLSRRRLRLVTG